MKFKVGEKVRLKGTKSYGNSWEKHYKQTSMKKGKIVTISDIFASDKEYGITGGGVFKEQDFEPINKPQFKVGDRVKVRSNLELDGYVPRIQEMKGKIFTIESIHANLYSLKDGYGDWNNHELELIFPDLNETLIPVTNIDQLKVGDRVKQIEVTFSGESDYVTITGIKGDSVKHHHDNKKYDNRCDDGVTFQQNLFQKVISNETTIKQEGGEKMKVGDRVKFVDKKSGDSIPSFGADSDGIPKKKIVHGSTIINESYDRDYAKIVDTYNEYYIVEYMSVRKNDVETGNHVRLGFKENVLELVDEINTEVNKMEKPETQLEKDALVKAKEDVVEAEIENKAITYKANMREYMDAESNARRYRKQANEMAEKLGITPAEKKQLK